MLAFVSHYDCSRHDTGWNHPDHQGRLPALMRAVHADMLTLFDHLLEVEGRHASVEELMLLHTSAYLERVREWVADAHEKGETIEVAPNIRISAASWEAATASVGCVLSGIDRVLGGDALSAFCAVRPAGRYATAGSPGGFGLFNQVAIGARNLAAREPSAPIVVVEWGGAARSPVADLLNAYDAKVVGVYGPSENAFDSDSAVLPRGASRDAFLRAVEQTLGSVSHLRPAMILLSCGFDGMAGDPVGDLGLEGRDYYDATFEVRELAERCCGGRVVSILEGGYDARALGSATVQHLRAMAGLAPIE